MYLYSKWFDDEDVLENYIVTTIFGKKRYFVRTIRIDGIITGYELQIYD